MRLFIYRNRHKKKSELFISAHITQLFYDSVEYMLYYGIYLYVFYVYRTVYSKPNDLCNKRVAPCDFPDIATTFIAIVLHTFLSVRVIYLLCRLRDKLK